MSHRVLLINPTIGHHPPDYFPHLGLGILAAKLSEKSHAVLVADYNGNPKTSNIETLINEFKPDAVGVSTYTPSWPKVLEIIKKIRNYSLPVVLGGAHVSCYMDELSSDKNLDVAALVSGEADDLICQIINDVLNNKNTDGLLIYKSDNTLNGAEIATPNFKSFFDYEQIEGYPLMTSRGCPYDCSFCAVKLVSSRKWRYRPVENCIDEIRFALRNYPNLKRLTINDDCFTLDLNRAKKFLKDYLKLGANLKLELSNVRADRIDQEFARLLKQCNCSEIGIGIEHANPIVYNAINKKEDFSKIEEACKIVRQEGLDVAACMVIGLPYDNESRVRESIKFVKKIRASHIYWNMFTPLKGTQSYEWFMKNGYIYSGVQGFSPASDSIIIEEPLAETKDFTREQRVRAYLMAKLSTGDFPFKKPLVILKSLPYLLKFKVLRYLFVGFLYGLRIRMARFAK